MAHTRADSFWIENYADKTDTIDLTYLHTRSEGKFFNLKILWALAKMHKMCIRELLYTDDNPENVQ